MFAYFPRRDTPSSQVRFQATQLRHGCISSTLHRTRRELQAKHAFFARRRGFSEVVLAIMIIEIGCFLKLWGKWSYIRIEQFDSASLGYFNRLSRLHADSAI